MPKPVQQEGDDPDPTPYLFVSLEQKRIDQTKPYDAKKACWVPDEKEGYVLGEIKATKGDLVTVSLPGGEDKNFKKDQVSQVNPPKYEKCEDMSSLTYLNDASVLHNLKQRYYIKLIYLFRVFAPVCYDAAIQIGTVWKTETPWLYFLSFTDSVIRCKYQIC
ncbi:hypothetical protein Cfor_06941 [Coptotermes formosanus]|uniref:Myosin N-terminal SH3-like domain-containing protein n=1 Tax=Coptotermes formosanus TaxID=36987 RepID=A0A6L2PC26_COPFO|nr:hypothetical protein Cfor_06941 [Coptotermes formosanus]